MSGLAGAREAIAAAVASTGLACTPYAPDSLAPPAAWIDSISIDYDTRASFCAGSGEGEATVIACGQRNDRAGTMQQLEGLLPEVLAALEDVGGVRVSQVASGNADVGGQTLPAVLITVQFNISIS